MKHSKSRDGKAQDLSRQPPKIADGHVTFDVRLVSEGQTVSFKHDFDLSELSFYDERPIAEPLTFEGSVKNSAGLLQLAGTVSSNLHLVCDRCLKPFNRVKSVKIHKNLTVYHVTSDDDDSDALVYCPGGFCDLEDMAQIEYVLDMDTKNLCKENCLGLCEVCGHDLNEGPCEHQ